VRRAEIIARPELNNNINSEIGIKKSQSQVICWPKATITKANKPNWGKKLMNCRRTAEMGKRILGKLKVLSNPELEVIAFAPEEKEPEKKEKRKTPVIRKGMKFGGRKSPRMSPNTKP
jgi:hypothetical protein